MNIVFLKKTVENGRVTYVIYNKKTNKISKVTL